MTTRRHKTERLNTATKTDMKSLHQGHKNYKETLTRHKTTIKRRETSTMRCQRTINTRAAQVKTKRQINNHNGTQNYKKNPNKKQNQKHKPT